MESESALKIADGLQCLRLKPDSPYTPREGDVIINWGSTKFPKWYNNWENTKEIWLNPPPKVGMAADKKQSLLMFKEKEVPCPEFTSDVNLAKEWAKKMTVVARTVLNGHSGQGIILCDKDTENFPVAPLYVKYKKKSREYRVHVFQGDVIDVQQKKKRLDFDKEVNTKIRSFDNGWVFCRDGIECPEDLYETAVSAVAALGLDFGAVDVIYNLHENKCYALEVNTAPGLEGETMFSYVITFLNYIEAL
jgi:glutathione synthase/RimK-type ligase-like ATP-grasp enzyme